MGKVTGHWAGLKIKENTIPVKFSSEISK